MTTTYDICVDQATAPTGSGVIGTSLGDRPMRG